MDRKRAFTLIELLVVVSIIALLVSILLPALGKARERAKTVICSSNVRQWALIFRMYTDDNNGMFMEGLHNQVQASDEFYKYIWVNVLHPYYTNVDILLCPKATRAYSAGAEAPDAASTFGGLYAEDGSVTEGALTSYGVNFAIMDPPPEREKAMYFKKVPSSGLRDIPMVTDCTFWRIYPDYYDLPTLAWEPFNPSYALTQNKGMRRVVIDRHDGYINGAMMDGSARKLGIRGLWRLQWTKDWIVPYQIYDASWLWPDWLADMPDELN